MTTLTLVLAPTGPLDSVRDALQDWSGAGLIDRVLWIEPHMITRSDVSALSIENGRLEGITLERVLGGADLTRVYLTVLVPVLAGHRVVHPEVERYVAEYVEATRYDAAATYVRAIITRVGERATSDVLAVDGWHNIVLSPEDSTGPGMGATELRSSTVSPTLGAHTAAGLAGLLGLWTDVATGPLDGDDGAVGGIRLARSYYRHLGAHGVETQLRSRVYDVSGGVPLPSGASLPVEYFNRPAEAAQAMSDRLWARHGSVLSTSTPHTRADTPSPVGGGERWRLFGGFLASALRNSVRPWVARAYQPVSAEPAAMMHSHLVNADPASYAVLTNGTLGGGLAASWADTRHAAGSLLAACDPGGEASATDPTVSLWRDYASGGFTLIDAGEREVGLPPIQEGASLRVVTETNLALPGDGVSFQGLSQPLAETLGMRSVAPYDVLATRQLDARLGVVERRGASAANSDTALVRRYFDEWRSYYAATYAGQVGGRIGDAYQRALTGAREHLAVLRTASGGHVELREVIDTQQGLLRWVQIGAGVTLVLMILSVWFGVQGTPLALGGVVLFPLAWLGTCSLIYARGGRGLVDLINSRRVSVGKEGAARQHVAAALADVCRLGIVYEQFLAWSRILGSVTDAPFGTPSRRAEAPETMVSDLPLSMRLGAAQTGEDQLAAAVVPLRGEVFETGWLSECWAAIVAAAPERLGVRAADLATGPQTILGAAAAAGRPGEESLLSVWAEALASSGVDASAGDEQWQRILDALGGRLSDVSDGLLGSVIDSRQLGVTVASDTFLRGLDSLQPLPNDRMSDGIMTEGARAVQLARVDRSHVDGSRRGLSRVMSLSQLTVPFGPVGLVAHHATPVLGQHS
ncbi:hypothetical protein GCM10022198_23830 [Klugiella xanthotipulae]|uniref:Uncharacterized protein n=1 Tax=Klugiella xanthotipulae TaxID=244735 RepID=A0A543I6Q4_9MICO|nr:hypothetical protein [Klugiella xanthotipulae]TQM66170.1 hypothetical protein FB466_1000 [Klugiella xanthotipulae]